MLLTPVCGQPIVTQYHGFCDDKDEAKGRSGPALALLLTWREAREQHGLPSLTKSQRRVEPVRNELFPPSLQCTVFPHSSPKAVLCAPASSLFPYVFNTSRE